MGIDVNAIEQTVVVTAVGDEVNVNVIDQPVLVSVTDQIIEVEASGGTGPQGPAGAGVAIGGTTGQVLSKASNTNYDTVWVDAGAGTVYSVNASGSTGISVTGGPITGAGTLTITNTLPDQIVGLTGAGTAVITGTYPNFTITTNDEFDGTVTSVNLTAGTGISVSGGPIVSSGSISVTNTAPDQVVSLTGGGTTTITGTYPNFTISSADSNVGTVTSVDMTVPTGLTISGNPITSAGTLALALASGYSIPTTANQANWTTAYNDSIVSAGVTGTTTKTLTLNQQDGGTVTASWTDINTDAVTSVFGRTGAVVSAEGDYTLTQLGDVTITSPTTGQVLKYNGTTWVNNTDTDTGLTSVGLSMPSAFAVSNSPLTSNGTLSVTGAGTSAQYIRGDGSLDTFPSLTGFVPYTGATTNVNLGTHTLTANDLVINHPSGSGAAASISKGGNGEALTVVKGSGSGNAASITGGVTLLDELHLTTDLADAYIASAATWNAKQNALNGTGFVKISGTTISYDNSTYYLASNPSAYIALTALSAGAGISYNNTTGVIASTITQYTNADARLAISESVTGLDYDNTTGVFTLTSGYVIPTTTSATNWDAAYNDKINSAAVTGTTTKTLTLNQQDGGTITASWTDDNTDAVTSVFGRTGAVIATSGDYSTTLVTEGTNLYYTEGRVSANTDVAANTAARHNAVTIGTANGLSLSTQQLSLALASGSTTGALSSTDWTTFNNKQNTITNPVTGTGTTNYLPKWTSGSAIGNSIISASATLVTNNFGTSSLFFGQSGSTRFGFATGTATLAFSTGLPLVLGTFDGQPLVFGTNNSEYARITDGGNLLVNSTTDNGNRLQVTGDGYFSGNVGIGATPTARLQVGDLANTGSVWNDILITGDRVNANGYYARLIFKNSSQSGGSSASIRGERSNASNFATSLTFFTNGTASAGDGSERMRLDASGNLGLGVVPSAWGSAYRVGFQVGSSAIGGVAGAGASDYFSIGGNYYLDNTPQYIYRTSTFANRFEASVGEFRWYTAPSGTAGNAISFTQAMTLNASGQLGIGTTSPDTKLDVRGEISVAYNATYGLRFYNNARNNWSFIGNSVTGSSAANLRFGDYTGEVVRITDGLVGIGTTSPGAKLDVRGRTNIWGAGTTSATLGLSLLDSPGSNYNFYVEDNGGVYIRGNTRIGNSTDNGYKLDVQGTTSINGEVGLKITPSSSAILRIQSGTTSQSQIKLEASTAPTSPNNGDIWFDGSDLKMRIGGVTKTFTLV